MSEQRLSDFTKLSRPELTSKFGSFKTWIERRAKTNADQVRLCENAAICNRFLEDSVDRALANSRDTIEKFTATADALSQAYSKEEETEAIITAKKDVEASVERYLNNIEDSMNRLQTAFSELQERELEAVVDPNAGGGGGGGGGGAAVAAAPGAPKSVDALKPQVLFGTDTPTKFEGWCTKAKVWIKASKFMNAERDEQLVYFCSIVEEPLWKRIEPLIGATTPIMAEADEDPSCLQILRDEFMKLYPLFNRRLDYFRSKPKSGETLTEYVNELQIVWAAAELEDLSVDESVAFKIMTDFSKDDALTNEFLKLDSPTVKDLIEVGQRLESQRLAKQKLKDATKANQTRSGNGGRGGGGNNGGGKGNGGARGGSGGKGGSGKPKEEKSKDEKEKKKTKKKHCRYCNWSFSKQSKLDSHEAKCPAKDGKCDNCKEDGHFKPACPKLAGKK